MSFNFTDYEVYSQSAGVPKESVAITALGVITYIKNIYKIDLQSRPSVIIDITIAAGETTYTFDTFPITSVTSITDPDGVEVGFTFSGLTITLDEASDDNITYTVDYAIAGDTTYADLKIAIYRHIDATVYAATNHTDSIAKVVNGTGNTTTFVNDFVPAASKAVYDFYSPRQVILF